MPNDLLITVQFGDELVKDDGSRSLSVTNSRRLKITAADPLDAAEAARMVASAVRAMRRERTNEP